MALSITDGFFPPSVENAIARAQERTMAMSSALSSGSTLSNRDGAVLGVSAQLGAQTAGAMAAVGNADSGLGLLQTADGAVSHIDDILGQMQVLALTASNPGITADDRGALDMQYQALGAEVAGVAGAAAYNGSSLLDGSMGSTTLQIGPNNGAADRLTLNIPALSLDTLGLSGGSVQTVAGADQALSNVAAALNQSVGEQAYLGASQQALQFAGDSMSQLATSDQEAQSRLIDTDYASASGQNAQDQLLQSFEMALSAQANSAPSTVLQLLTAAY